MLLLSIILGTALAGSVSVLLASSLSLTSINWIINRLIPLSIGLLLGSALLNLLPEAIEEGLDAHVLFSLLFTGILLFFLLEKTSLFRHTHHHEGDGHHHEKGFDALHAGRGGWTVLVGNSLHNLTDGVLIAAAFLANPKLGWLTALAIIAHEIPQQIGDFAVLINAGFSRLRAFAYNLTASMFAVVGGITSYFVLAQIEQLIPYILVLVSSSFIYIAVSDLIPQVQLRHIRHPQPYRETAVQLALILLGAAIIYLSSAGHHH